MHSSRMRTAHSLTVCHARSHAMHAPHHTCPPAMHTPLPHTHPPATYTLPPATHAPTHVSRMTDASENITLPQTSLRAVKIQHNSHLRVLRVYSPPGGNLQFTPASVGASQGAYDLPKVVVIDTNAVPTRKDIPN